MKNRKITIGADPEIFVKDSKTNKISSIIGKLGGTKVEPIDIGEGCFVQEDNVLAEFNIPPVTTLEQFLSSMNYAKDYISTIISPNNLELHFSSSEILPDEVLQDPNAKKFGCAPSFNMLSGKIESFDESEIDIETLTMRSSGFHIHIGYEDVTEDMNERLVLAFELFVTLPLVDRDNDCANRRMLYGRIGDCREKDYGVECRSLGGYFLKDDESLTLVWEQTQKAITFAFENDMETSQIKELLNFCLDSESNISHTNVKEVLHFLETENIAVL